MTTHPSHQEEVSHSCNDVQDSRTVQNSLTLPAQPYSQALITCLLIELILKKDIY